MLRCGNAPSPGLDWCLYFVWFSAYDEEQPLLHPRLFHSVLLDEVSWFATLSIFAVTPIATLHLSFHCRGGCRNVGVSQPNNLTSMSISRDHFEVLLFLVYFGTHILRSQSSGWPASFLTQLRRKLVAPPICALAIPVVASFTQMNCPGLSLRAANFASRWFSFLFRAWKSTFDYSSP